MSRPWEADTSAAFSRRMGLSPQEAGKTSGPTSCPDIWELTNGDFAFIGRDVTAAYAGRLPDGVSVGNDERIVVIPRTMVAHAKDDLPGA